MDTPTTREGVVEVMARGIRPGAHLDATAFEYALSDAEAALTALEEAGCAVVPREATEEMEENGHHRLGDDGTLGDLYTAMLSASPFVREREDG